MNAIEKVKEKVAEHLTSSAIALLLVLSLIIYRAVSPATWKLIDDTIPKPVVWALLGITTVAIVGLLAYIFQLRKRLKKELIPRFGVYWSKKDHVPHCPACEKPLSNYDHYNLAASGMTWAFICLNCKAYEHLYDKDGKKIELKTAVELLSVKG